MIRWNGLIVGWCLAMLAATCAKQVEDTAQQHRLRRDTMFRADPRLFQESFDQKKFPPGNYKGTFYAYWMTVKGGAVTKVEEQCFP